MYQYAVLTEVTDRYI